MMIVWYLIGLLLLLVVMCEFYTFKTGVPTITSFPSARRKMIELIKEEAASHARGGKLNILDLGSGTGKLALEIGREMPEAQIAGVEISLVPFVLSKLRQLLWRVFLHVGNVGFYRRDFWSYDISGLDIAVIYMNANIRDRMAKKLAAELPAGALVISNETYLPDWTPLAVHDVGVMNLKVVVYRKA